MVEYYVAVEIRIGSPTYGRYVTIELSEDHHPHFFVPWVLACGIVVLCGSAVFQYKCGNLYASQADEKEDNVIACFAGEYALWDSQVDECPSGWVPIEW